MKYIIIEGEYGEVPIVFGDSISHDIFIKLKIPIKSAGFVKITPITPSRVTCTCHGSSHSLDMKPREDDDILIESCLAV